MKTLGALRALAALHARPHPSNFTSPAFLLRRYAAQPQEDSDHNDSDSVFNSADYAVPPAGDDRAPRQPTWSDKIRRRADEVLFGDKPMRVLEVEEEEEDLEEEKRRVLAKALLEAALLAPDAEDDDEEEMAVMEEDQKSLAVGIIGAPNAGKSALTNFMVWFLIFKDAYLLSYSWNYATQLLGRD